MKNSACCCGERERERKQTTRRRPVAWAGHGGPGIARKRDERGKGMGDAPIGKSQEQDTMRVWVCVRAPTGLTRSTPSLPHAHAPGLVLQVSLMIQSPPAGILESFSPTLFPDHSLTKPSGVKRRVWTWFGIWVLILIHETTSCNRAEGARTGQSSPHSTLPAPHRLAAAYLWKRNGQGRAIEDLHELGPNRYDGRRRW